MQKLEPYRLSATAAAHAIAQGKLTSEALTKACLAHIEAREADVGAWAHLDPEFALAQARAADKAQKMGQTLGPLHGVPVGVKDIIDVAGLGGEHGAAIFAGRRPETDAVCVSQLKAAGAVILGKTVTTELANRTPGKTRNPHDPDHTPGGSSSGSAAGIADSMMPLALATQTAGSVIRPASYCGIYAIKPTFGLVPRRGALLQSHTLDTVGLYARSVEDLALGLGALDGYDQADPSSFPRARTDYISALRPTDGVKRLAFMRTPVWMDGDETMRQAIVDFAASLGKYCEEVPLTSRFDHAKAHHAAVMASEAAYYYGPLMDAHPDKMSAPLRDRLRAARTVPAHDYIRALEEREPLYAEIAEILTTYDAILTPSAPGCAPKGLSSTGDPVFNSIWTYLGVPSVTLPLLQLDGLPLGVQLIGRRREDAKLLGTAKWLAGIVA